MSVGQACIVLLCIAGLGGCLWLCYIAIRTNDADEAERRRGRK
jgi:hypothetical protein